MVLDASNYYSEQANREYMSVSQFKEFVGTYGMPACEARALAEVKGEYCEPASTAMMIGSYVDSYFEGTLDLFRSKVPGLFKKNGELRAEYKKADELIARVEKDPVFMNYMSGEKQVIMTGEIGGVPWKIKIDSYLEGMAIVDLKVMESLTKLKFVRDVGYLDFIRYWGYDIQGAVYQEIVRQNTGRKLPFFIAGISKEPITNFEVIHVYDSFLNEAMNLVTANIAHVIDVKNGVVAPERCDTCGYCRKTKVLKHPIGIPDLAAEV